jgi:hypothetical protein
LTGQGITTVGIQNDFSKIGSGKNASGIPDVTTVWNHNELSTTRGIHTTFNIETPKMGDGDGQNFQNTCLTGGQQFNGF